MRSIKYQGISYIIKLKSRNHRTLLRKESRGRIGYTIIAETGNNVAFILAVRYYRLAEVKITHDSAIEVDLQFCTLSSMTRRTREHDEEGETRVTCFFRLI